MNKIGILTFHFPENRNFGAILQAYACLNLIKNSTKKKVEIINYTPFKYGLKGRIVYYLNGLGFKSFSDKFLNINKKCKELKILNKEFDTFIVGSDQVWRVKYTKDNALKYYFDFVEENQIKIAYAASFGVDFWEGDKEITKKIKPLVQRFDYVSVREESGVKICKDEFEIDAVNVLDPTLMIDKRNYQPILDDWKDESHKKNKYIAYMLLDDTAELRQESNNIGKYLKSEINYIKGKDRKVLGKTITFYNKVSQWLTYLKDAELVITDSFHCTVFSLIFNKKFVVVANPERGTTRLENLLEITGLKDRFFTDIKDILKSGILDKSIDYMEVESRLNIHREFSMNFLKRALKGRKGE